MSESASAASGSPKRLQIRKYPNRRYYDTTRSRHVTLDEIYSLIREGYEVQVTDSKSGQDITTKILAQIIIELDAPKLGVFPVPMLHRLLRANSEIVDDFIEKYFNQPLTAFLDSQRNMEQYFRQAMGFGTPAPTMADWAKVMWGPFSPSFWSTGRANGSSANSTSSTAAPNGDTSTPDERQQRELRQQIDHLRKQVADLQSQLASRGVSGGAAGSPGRKARVGGKRKN